MYVFKIVNIDDHKPKDRSQAIVHWEIQERVFALAINT